MVLHHIADRHYGVVPPLIDLAFLQRVLRLHLNEAGFFCFAGITCADLPRQHAPLGLQGIKLWSAIEIKLQRGCSAVGAHDQLGKYWTRRQLLASLLWINFYVAQGPVTARQFCERPLALRK